jgi:lipoprotein-anchoring transpeptidase ErfK/SrfK
LRSFPNASRYNGGNLRNALAPNAEGNTPYWFSIALHGTPNESSDIGKANSGGCIHVEQNVLKKLVEEGAIEIGTRVIITDNRLNSAKSP